MFMTAVEQDNGFFVGIWDVFLRDAFPVLIKQFSLKLQKLIIHQRLFKDIRQQKSLSKIRLEEQWMWKSAGQMSNIKFMLT